MALGLGGEAAEAADTDGTSSFSSSLGMEEALNEFSRESSLFLSSSRFSPSFASSF